MEISNYVHIDARAESYNSRFITASIMGRASNLYPVVYQTSSKYSEIRNFVFLVTTMLANLKWKFLILFCSSLVAVVDEKYITLMCIILLGVRDHNNRLLRSCISLGEREPAIRAERRGA